MSGIIALTTDFGLTDPFVGVMKGVILGVSLRGSVVHVDRFGNLVTNIPSATISGVNIALSVDVAGHHIDRLSRNYRGEGLLALIGSSGYLEIAVSEGSAAAELGATHGTAVVVHLSRSQRLRRGLPR